MSGAEGIPEVLESKATPIQSIQIGMNTLKAAMQTGFSGMSEEELRAAVLAVEPAVSEIVMQNNEGKQVLLGKQEYLAGNGYE